MVRHDPEDPTKVIGQPFSAADVKATFDRILNGYKQAATMYENNTFMKVWLAP